MVVTPSVTHMSLIVAGIETEEVGWGRGGVVLTFIESLAVWPSVIKLLNSALTASHWARRLHSTVPAAD